MKIGDKVIPVAPAELRELGEGIVKIRDITKTGRREAYVTWKSGLSKWHLEEDLQPAHREPRLVAEKEKPGPRPKKVREAPSEPPSTIAEAFGAKPGSNRAKLLAILGESMGEPVPLADALEAVYGSREEGAGKIGKVVAGLQATIAEGSLPYSLEVSRKGGTNFTLKEGGNDE